MPATEAKRRILWAVDPFCRECDLVQHTAQAVATLAAQWHAEVEPVYVLNNVPRNVKIHPSFIREVKRETQNALQRILSDAFPASLILEIRPIIQPNSRLRDQADILIDDARSAGASLIAIGTRARSGPKRWVMGSFAETLITRSDVPLYIINPREAFHATVPVIRDILFPTDFSEQSRAAFEHVIAFAMEIKASLTVFHKVRCDLTPIGEAAFNAFPYSDEVFQQDTKALREQAESWASEARQAGLQARSVVNDEIAPSVSEAILRRARGQGEMIALAAHSGPIASALLGSVTRQVIRIAECPVWVIHTEQKARALLPSTPSHGTSAGI